MHPIFTNYKKEKEYLICVDSDGCAMDTMNIKHIKCFGPCMVDEWELTPWKDEIMARWNEINLYTMHRGINRFQGLVLALKEIHAKYKEIEGLDVLSEWLEHASELSDDSLRKEISNTDASILRKALKWSETVNREIQMLSDEEKKAFPGVKEALSYAHQFADIAVVSSANRQAVVEEWEMRGLLEHTDVVLAQDVGGKAYCIHQLAEKGYDRKHILMVGDAPGDYEAAMKNDVLYYPILVRHETQSWKEFEYTGLEKFLQGTYEGLYQNEKAERFTKNLM